MSASVEALFKHYMKKKKSENDHAVFSASGSERWLNCPGSIKLCQGIPKEENKYSIRGTHTHTLLQFILENVGWKDLLKLPEAKPLLNEIEYDEKMLANALFAARFVWQEKCRMELKYGVQVKLLTEVKIKLEGVGHGTSDVILYHPYGLLHVMDYKNGRALIEPQGNTQGLYYAHGAADLFNWEFSEIHITIIQPNVTHKDGHIRTWKTDEETLKKANIRFLKGVEAAKRPDAPLVTNSSWCWFCPAREKCPAQADHKRTKLLERFSIAQQWETIK